MENHKWRISNLSLREQVYKKLKEAILEGTLPRNTKLTEQELSERFGVSRTPIREALQKLQSEGLVEVLPRRHCIVLGLTKQDVIYINRIRSVLEALAAKETTATITPEELENLRDELQAMEKYGSLDYLESYLAAHKKFHQILIDGCPNRWLKDIIATFGEYIANIRRWSLSFPERFDKGMAEHRAIFSAVEKRKPEEVEELVRKHIADFEEFLETKFDVINTQREEKIQ